MNPLDDIEKTQVSGTKETTDGNFNGFQRPVNGFKWFLVCVGLYLGAVLYGEPFYAVFIKLNTTDRPTQASTQPSPQMCKVQSSDHLER